jgi:hypothetical protein
LKEFLRVIDERDLLLEKSDVFRRLEKNEDLIKELFGLVRGLISESEAKESLEWKVLELERKFSTGGLRI